MKANNVLSQTPIFFMLMLVLLIVAVVGPAMSQPGYGQSGYGQNQPSMNQYPSSNMPAGANPGQGQQVTVYDKGLQMPVGTYTVPAGWQIVQDMATDPNTGQPISQKMDIVGPQGELLRSIGMAQYADMMGANFEQTWQQMVSNSLQNEFDMIDMGTPGPSARMQRNPMIQQYAQNASQQGFKLECLEAQLGGNRSGQSYQGLVSIMHLTPVNMPNMGTIQVSVTLSPANQLQQTLALGEQISGSFQPNPQYQQRLQQIQQKMMGSYGNTGQYNPTNGQNTHQEYIQQIRQPNAGEYPGQGYDPYQSQPGYPNDNRPSQQKEWY